MNLVRIPIVARSICIGVAMTLSSAAIAQPVQDEIMVTGRYGTVPDSVQSLSRPISYADLDLGTIEGRRVLEHRVRLTARYLCGKLGETDVSSPIVSSCHDSAVRDAMQRVGTTEANYAPRGTTWVAGSAWVPDYPADWDARYP